jgi:hypothetical protein
MDVQVMPMNTTTSSVHLRLPTSLLEEMKALAESEDAGGLSSLVRRACRQYIWMAQQQQGSPTMQQRTPEQQPKPDTDFAAHMLYLKTKDPGFVRHLESFGEPAQKLLAAQRVAHHKSFETE